MNRTLINFAAFQAGWFTCVLGAANGMPWLGLLAVSLVVALHVRTAGQPANELRLLALCVIIGLVFDSLLVASGWVRYPNGMLLSGMAPYWILAMWALFSTTLNYSMGWLKSSLPLASVMGAVFGPLSYLAGQRLGAIELLEPLYGLLALAFIWAVVMPTLVYVAVYLDHRRKAVPVLPLQKLTETE
ncbi:MAG: DUF2878 domain-containing protein [Xanthomonadales bacterium]|nr:DUF2878 domain-containing protein [Xanthomonadales bacterium]